MGSAIFHRMSEFCARIFDVGIICDSDIEE